LPAGAVAGMQAGNTGRVGDARACRSGPWGEHSPAPQGDKDADMRPSGLAQYIASAGTPFAAMGVGAVRRVAGLERAGVQAGRGNGRGGLVIVAIDETGQEKAGEATAGRQGGQYLCPFPLSPSGERGRVSQRINYRAPWPSLRAGRRRARAESSARQWTPPQQHRGDPVSRCSTWGCRWKHWCSAYQGAAGPSTIRGPRDARRRREAGPRPSNAGDEV